jgi:hypothetical protein
VTNRYAAQCYADKLAEKGENKINEQIAVEMSIRYKVSSIVFELKNEQLTRFQLNINCTYKNSSALYLIRSGLSGDDHLGSSNHPGHVTSAGGLADRSDRG